MNQLLTLQQTLHLQQSGLECTVERFLGGGAQGEVYEVTLAGQALALKWYFPQYLLQDPGLRQRIEQIIRIGAPSDRFLWPQDLATRAGDPNGFGYLMPLREARFQGMADLVTRRVTPSFRALVTTAFELAYNYRELHAKGLCYRDIAFGNVFFDPTSGEVRICDNDNVDVNDAPGAISGTPRFMAPEIVRGESEPTVQSDLFSLAVLLFYLLCNHHPLEGKQELAIHCFDQPAMTRLYGHEACFIFDPNDESNRPVPGVHDNALAFWPLYPQFLRTAFTRAFTTGIHDPQHGRVRESEWCRALLRLRDAILYCPQCAAENFYDVAALRAGQQPGCWSCQALIPLPPRLRIRYRAERATEDAIVLLNHDTQLYAHHLDDARPFDFGEPWAAVTKHPSDPTRWGLQNLSAHKWVATVANGAVRDVLPGRTVALAAGTRILFGPSEAELRV